jgi:hypothetical protein
MNMLVVLISTVILKKKPDNEYNLLTTKET